MGFTKCQGIVQQVAEYWNTFLDSMALYFEVVFPGNDGPGNAQPWLTEANNIRGLYLIVNLTRTIA